MSKHSGLTINCFQKMNCKRIDFRAKTPSWNNDDLPGPEMVDIYGHHPDHEISIDISVQ